MSNRIKPSDEMIGERNDLLTIIRYVGVSDNGHRQWLCKCDCGNTIIKTTNELHAKKRHSCGCLRRNHPNNTKHGMCYTRINSTYRKMKQRCLSESDKRYKDYGGRGIKVCDEWLGDDGFNRFYEWSMANGYSDNLTIDRIDVNGNYEPSNCRWVTNLEQSKNTRRSVKITYQGKTMILKDWSRELGIPYETLRNRILKFGWSIERAFTEEPKHGRKTDRSELL